MRRAYKFRLYPTRAQRVALDRQQELLRDFWNAALQQRKEAYSRQRRTLWRRDQEPEITALKHECPEYEHVHTHLLQDVLRRLDLGYEQFFSRIIEYRQAVARWRAKGADLKHRPACPGPPRFKARGRYRSGTIKDVVHHNGAALVAGEKRLRIAGVGKVKIKLHRPTEGTLKQITVVVTGYGHVYAILSCDDVPVHSLPPTGERTALDVGLATLATLPEEEIPNPRFYRSAERELARAQRRVSRRVKGSRRRRKAVRVLSRKHARVANARRDYQTKVAHELVRRYDSIAHEGDLNIAGMARGSLAKSVHDAGMSQFLQILRVQAESAGREDLGVRAAGTSQECPGTMPDGTRCTARVPKTLRDRKHVCLGCGLVTTRDRASAGVIHWRAFDQGPGQGLRGGVDSSPPRSSGACHAL
jgi:putative transposase